MIRAASMAMFMIVIPIAVVGTGCNKSAEEEYAQKRAQEVLASADGLFQKQEYRKAMWKYQGVIELYSSPSTKDLVSQASRKEWLCRAYLNDWVPAKGDIAGDVRVLHPDDYEQYKKEIEQITPIVELVE